MKEYSTCAEAREEFSALLDGELELGEQEGLERHLAECSDCLRELDGLKKVSDAYEEVPDLGAPDGLIDEIRDELESPEVHLSESHRAAIPISFKPVLVAAACVVAMAIVSYLVSQGASNLDGAPPPLIDEAE